MSGDADGLTIVVPVYNEREGLEGTVQDLLRVTAGMQEETEIIIVDDGSDDGTGEILDRLAADGSMRVVRHSVNRGYGAALKSGIEAGRFEFVGITDADGTYPNDVFPALMQRLRDEGADMIVGARTGRDVRIPLVRKPAKFVLNRLANYLAGCRIPDLNSGMRIMKKAALRPFMPILPDGFSFTTTITLAMLTNRHDVRYESIRYASRRGRSKIRPFHDTLSFLQLIIRTVLYFNPLKVFIPLSAGLALLAVAILVGSLFFLDRAMDVTFGVVLMTSVSVLSIGMLADLIDKRLR